MHQVLTPTLAAQLSQSRQRSFTVWTPQLLPRALSLNGQNYSSSRQPQLVWMISRLVSWRSVRGLVSPTLIIDLEPSRSAIDKHWLTYKPSRFSAGAVRLISCLMYEQTHRPAAEVKKNVWGLKNKNKIEAVFTWWLFNNHLKPHQKTKLNIPISSKHSTFQRVPHLFRMCKRHCVRPQSQHILMCVHRTAQTSKGQHPRSSLFLWTLQWKIELARWRSRNQ